MLGAFERNVEELYLYVEDINPHSNRKMLKYVLPESSDVSIIICDMNGNEVMKVLNEYMIRGSYTCSIDVSSLDTGIYDCVIKSGEHKYAASLYILT